MQYLPTKFLAKEHRNQRTKRIRNKWPAAPLVAKARAVVNAAEKEFAVSVVVTAAAAVVVAVAAAAGSQIGLPW